MLFPEAGLTKRDLVAYYAAMAPALLPFLRDRPLMLKQYPEGIGGKFFFRQAAPKHTPSWVATHRERAASVGHDVTRVMVNDLPSLLWLANQAVIELHCWLARRDAPDEPDVMVFDLDPGADLDIRAAREVALLVRDRLARDGIEALPKLSGKRGVHVMVRLAPGQSFARSRAYAARVARDLDAARPDLVTADYDRREERRGCVLIDYAQNAHGKVTVGPYSVRPTPRATVSMPLPWRDLEGGTPDPNDYTIQSVPRLVAERGDLLGPWLDRAQRLPA
ncbi:MAG TPA: non-homologous end-joining DNA ligase [Chloroflexota bacterium]|nr:non-homologous end-joining DNA ligase [Chloroflexota bacterium]